MNDTMNEVMDGAKMYNSCGINQRLEQIMQRNPLDVMTELSKLVREMKRVLYDLAQEVQAQQGQDQHVSS